MTALMLNKRKRSADAISDSGTCHTEQTEASTPRREVNEGSKLLAQEREQLAEVQLQLEEQIRQAQERKKHVAVQLEQLEGCESSRDNLGVSDLRAQLQEYEQQEQQAQQRLKEQQQQFEAAVAGILGIPAGQQQAGQLAEAVQEQQQLQEAQAQQLAVEQQLAQPGFAVTDSSKHQAKKARRDRISHVWDWLQGTSSGSSSAVAAAVNNAGSNAAAATAGPPAAAEQQQVQEQRQVEQHHQQLSCASAQDQQSGDKQASPHKDLQQQDVPQEALAQQPCGAGASDASAGPVDAAAPARKGCP